MCASHKPSEPCGSGKSAGRAERGAGRGAAAAFISPKMASGKEHEPSPVAVLAPQKPGTGELCPAGVAAASTTLEAVPCVQSTGVFQDICCHGLGFNQFVTTIILKNGYGPPTPQSQPRSAPGRWLGHPAPPDPVYCRVSFAAGHCSCSLLDPARGGKPARLLPGRTFSRPSGLPPERRWQSTVQCRAEPCRAVPGGARGFLFVTGGPVSAGPR